MSLTGENLVGLFSCNESSRLYLYVHKMVIKGNQTQMSNKKREALIYKVSRSLASAEKGT